MQQKQTVAQKTKLAYDIDPAHSAAELAVKHLMIATVRGRVAVTRGSVVVDGDDVRVEADLAAATIDTGVKDRDAHLRSSDFLDADAHPVLRFASTRVAPNGANAWTMEGALTIRGVSRPVTIEVEREGEAIDPWGNKKVALVGRTTIDRSEWGLTWNAPLEAGGWLVGDKVKVELNVQLVERK